MRKIKKKWIVWACVGLAAALLLMWWLRPKPEIPVYLGTTELARMDLRSTVDVTGSVESVETVSVYCALSYPVESVAVQVGDVVSQGDVLCLLDTSSLESDIAVKQASISTSQQSAQLSLEQAQADLERARQELENDDNEDILDARSTVEDAERVLRQAQLSVNIAQDDLDHARRENREADEEVYSRAAINSLRSAFNQALIAQEDAEAALAQAQDKLERVTQAAKTTALEAYEDDLHQAQLDADMTAELLSLQQMRDDLVDCTVTAPAAGTVTAVHAQVGASGNGLLFVIEDTENLQVAAKIKEYDVNSVTLGDPVVIRADGAEGDEYDGVLTRIAPASYQEVSTTEEKTVNTDAEFAAEVLVRSRSHRLRIGMSARLNIVTEEKPGVLAVSYDAIAIGPAGENVLFVAEADADGGYIARMVPVELGLETDFYCEISGEGLKEGAVIILDAAGLQDGDAVLLDIQMAEQMADLVQAG